MVPSGPVVPPTLQAMNSSSAAFLMPGGMFPIKSCISRQRGAGRM